MIDGACGVARVVNAPYDASIARGRRKSPTLVPACDAAYFYRCLSPTHKKAVDVAFQHSGKAGLRA